MHLLQIQRTLSQVWACVRQHSVETCHECEGHEGGVPTAAPAATTTTTALHQHQKKQKCQINRNLSPIKSSFLFLRSGRGGIQFATDFFCRTQIFDLPNPCRHDDKTGVNRPHRGLQSTRCFPLKRTRLGNSHLRW